MSDKGGVPLAKWLGRGLWFLARVVILLVTNKWLRSNDEDDTTAKPAPSTFSPRKAASSSARSLRASDVVAAAERSVRRAERARALALSVAAGDGMVRWLDEAMIAPMRERLMRARASDPRALLELARTVPAHEASVAFLVHSLDARREPRQARVLADLEEVASALAEPLVALDGDSFVRVRKRRFVVAPDASTAELQAARESGLVVPLVLSTELVSDPRRWVLLANEVSRALLEDVANWLTELRGLLDLPTRMHLVPARAPHDGLTAPAMLGAWSSELLADVLATYMLGPSYAYELCAYVARSYDLERASLAEAEGRLLSSTPPARLRIRAALSVLEELGFDADAATLRKQYEIARSESVLRIPSLDGEHQLVPYALVSDALDELVSLVLQEPNAALGQRTWLDVPGLGFLHGEHGEARLAQAGLARGEKIALPIRVVVAAAALALQDRRASKELVLAGLLRSIRGVDALEPTQPRPATSSRPASTAQLRELASDPTAIREAIVLGAMLSPRRSMNRALSKR